MTPPTLTIRAVRCESCGGFGQDESTGVTLNRPCPTCHARGPEPGWVWPDADIKTAVDEWFLCNFVMPEGRMQQALNALYAAQEATRG